MRVYIAGPMTGKKLLNFPAFDETAAKIRACGHTPVSPADFDRVMWPEYDYASGSPPLGFNYELQLKIDLLLIETCEAVVFLPGWEDSRGASLEYAWAQALGLRTIKIGDL